MNDGTSQSENDLMLVVEWLPSKYLQKHDLEEKLFIKLMCARQACEVGCVIIALIVTKLSLKPTCAVSLN